MKPPKLFVPLSMSRKQFLVFLFLISLIIFKFMMKSSPSEISIMDLNQFHPLLIEYVKVNYLSPASNLTLKPGVGGGAYYFGKMFARLFKKKKGGFFIEAGAYDGISASNTIYLERKLNWSGLLIECNPKLIPAIKKLNRNVWIANICLAPGTTPSLLNFSVPVDWQPSGRIGKTWNISVNTKWEHFQVEAIPLYTILAGLGWNEVDFFSFDIEGSELQVLRGFPFDKVIFKVLMIEIQFYNAEEKRELSALLRRNNYTFVTNIEQTDYIFFHNSAKDELDLKKVVG